MELADEAFETVARRRRRYVLYRLLERETVTIDELARRIGAWERDQGVADVPDRTRERVRISLVHAHLPYLEDRGVVAYDPRGGEVARDERFDDLESIVAQLRERDSVPTPSG